MKVLSPKGVTLHRRPTSAIIDRSALRHNYLEIKKRTTPGTKVMAVVKANAYGHGDVQVARVFESMGCEFFGVAIPEEGARLRQAGIKAPVVVLGGIFPEQAPELFDLDLTPVIYDMETARLVNGLAVKMGVRKKMHLKVDTGMGRLGIKPGEVAPFLREFRSLKGLELEGVLSHLAEADSLKREFSETQLELFNETLRTVREDCGFEPALVHMANSAAVVDLADSRFNLVRPGIMLYGSYPSERFRGKIDLKPAMQIKTRILYLKSVPAGSPVSYGRTFVARRPSRIATLPIGYADGLPRRLSGSGEVLVKGKRVPIVGLVCMDLTMCDVTDVEGVETGDEVVVLGAQGSEAITAEEIAERAGTISYEIFCNISGRVPRVYI